MQHLWKFVIPNLQRLFIVICKVRSTSESSENLGSRFVTERRTSGGERAARREMEPCPEELRRQTGGGGGARDEGGGEMTTARWAGLGWEGAGLDNLTAQRTVRERRGGGGVGGECGSDRWSGSRSRSRSAGAAA